MVPERHFLEGLGDLFIGVLVEGVDVGPDRSREESGVLRNDGHVVAKRMQAELGCILVIKIDSS